MYGFSTAFNSDLWLGLGLQCVFVWFGFGFKHTTVLWLFHSVAVAATATAAAATFYLFIYVPFFVARTGFYNWSHLCGETLWKSCKVADSSLVLRDSLSVLFRFGCSFSIHPVYFFQFQRVHIQTRDNLYVVQISMLLQCLFMGSFWPLLLRSNVRKAWRILQICSSFCSSHIDFSFWFTKIRCNEHTCGYVHMHWIQYIIWITFGLIFNYIVFKTHTGVCVFVYRDMKMMWNSFDLLSQRERKNNQRQTMLKAKKPTSKKKYFNKESNDNGNNSQFDRQFVLRV